MARTSSESGLFRGLTQIHSIAVIVGTMIGAGIFAVTASAAKAMGPAVPIGFLLGIPIILSTALIYSVYMSSPLGRHPGGAYVHISRTWNSLFTGFLFMWLKAVSFMGALAVLSLGFGAAMRYFSVFTFLPAEWWAVCWLTFFFLLHLSGIDFFGHVQVALTAVLVIILLFLAIPGLFFVKPGNFTPLLPATLYAGGFVGPIIQGTAALMFSYIGFEALAQTAGETENPRETLPRVFGYSTIGVGVLYTVVAIVVVGVLGWQTAANASTPLTTAASHYFPLGTAGIVAFGSLLAYATSTSSTFMVPSRIFFSFAEDQLVPRLFGHVNDRFNTPDIGLLLTYLIAVTIILTSTFTFALSIALAALFLMYVAHSLSAVALPWVNPDLYEKCNLRFKPAVIGGIGLVSACSMAVFAWQTLALTSIGHGLAQLAEGQVVTAFTSNTALLLAAWVVVGVAIYIGYQQYLARTDTTVDPGERLKRLYEID